MRKHLRSRRALGIAVASAVAITLPGCAREVGGGGDGGSGGAASPGITDDSITLGITTPLSGATAGPGTCTVAGITAYFGAKNAEGGIEFGVASPGVGMESSGDWAGGSSVPALP